MCLAFCFLFHLKKKQKQKTLVLPALGGQGCNQIVAPPAGYQCCTPQDQWCHRAAGGVWGRVTECAQLRDPRLEHAGRL